MSYEPVASGREVPHDINVIIEIPAQADPIKYEVDKASGKIAVDRFMSTCMYYPCNYGYIPNTLSEDGDPIDVLVVTPYRVISGAIIRCRPVGMLKMTDESGVDYKILAVPHTKLSPIYAKVETYQDLPPLLIQQISHFFEHYKDLEPGKWVKVDDWVGPEAAFQEIEIGVARFKGVQ